MLRAAILLGQLIDPAAHIGRDADAVRLSCFVHGVSIIHTFNYNVKGVNRPISEIGHFAVSAPSAALNSVMAALPLGDRRSLAALLGSRLPRIRLASAVSPVTVE